MKKIFLTTTTLTLLLTGVCAQLNILRERIQHIITTKKADIGVAIYNFESKDSLSINNNRHYPLQSVFKFHIALAVLNEVDKGKLSLNQKIYISKNDLPLNTWSPIREEFPNGNVKLTLATILKYTVSQSDNIGCDILLRLIGGTKTVNDYIHHIGIKDVAINANEEDTHKEWNIQFSNWTTPTAAVALLKMFNDRKMLSKKSYDFLWNVMTETTTGKTRIKGQLPAGTLVAHKTGSSDTNAQGITAAVNDIGIVTLPNGNHLAISVFVSNSQENNETNEKTIADISKTTWDYFIDSTK